MSTLRCLVRLRESLDRLPKSEQRIAEYILANSADIPGMPISELAQICGTSKTTVVRLCKSIDYSGYKELCMMLHADLSSDSADLPNEIDTNGGLNEVITRVRDNNISAIRNTVDMLDNEALVKAVDLLESCSRVDFYGVGNSGFIALDAQNKFMRIGKLSVAQTDPHLQILSASSLHIGDLAIFISYTGETEDILETLTVAKKAGAATMSITRYGPNTLADAVDVRLSVMSDEGFIRSGAMASRIGLLTVIDILFSALTARNYSDYKPYLDRTIDAARLKKHTGHK
ncbi:MAG: MurR/RpiR family transcriptional regulator [Clostridiales bacterium]|nr:MurR/RpiR family transcriptional regulator [Clostridiales bacterium]